MGDVATGLIERTTDELPFELDCRLPHRFLQPGFPRRRAQAGDEAGSQFAIRVANLCG